MILSDSWHKKCFNLKKKQKKRVFIENEAAYFCVTCGNVPVQW